MERRTPRRDCGWEGQRVRSLHGRDAAAMFGGPRGPTACLPLKMRATVCKEREGGKGPNLQSQAGGRIGDSPRGRLEPRVVGQTR